MLRFTNEPYRLWLQRIDPHDEDMEKLLNCVDCVNTALFRQFGDKYDGHDAGKPVAGSS
jgi:hypothetical protein